MNTNDFFPTTKVFDSRAVPAQAMDSETPGSLPATSARTDAIFDVWSSARLTATSSVLPRNPVCRTSSLSCKGAGLTPLNRPPPYRRPCQLQGLVRRPVLPDHRGLSDFSVRPPSSLRISTVFPALRFLRLRLPRRQPLSCRACSPRASRIAHGHQPLSWPACPQGRPIEVATSAQATTASM